MFRTSSGFSSAWTSSQNMWFCVYCEALITTPLPTTIHLLLFFVVIVNSDVKYSKSMLANGINWLKLRSLSPEEHHVSPATSFHFWTLFWRGKLNSMRFISSIKRKTTKCACDITWATRRACLVHLWRPRHLFVVIQWDVICLTAEISSVQVRRSVAGVQRCWCSTFETCFHLSKDQNWINLVFIWILYWRHLPNSGGADLVWSERQKF